jgi:hypothetical protein
MARMDSYDDPLSKMALVLTSSQIAKNYLVEDHGIGEDLPFTFFFWRDGYIVFAVQLLKQHMNLAVLDRLSKCSDMSSAICSCWGITGISFVAEGFETLDKQKLDGRELRQAFIEEEGLVSECLTVTHCEINPINNKFELTLLSLPYSYELGRNVSWGKPLGFTSGMDKVLKSSAVSQMLITSLGAEPMIDVTDEEIDELMASIIADGFNIENL